MNKANTNPFLASLLEAARRSVIYVGVFSFFINILMLTIPLYMLQLFDRVLSSHSFDTLIFLSIIATFALAVYALLETCRSRLLLAISHWLDTILSPAALQQCADELLLGRRYGGQALRDISTLRQFISGSAMIAIFDAPWAPIYLLVIFMLHPLLGLASLIGMMILLFLAYLNEVATTPTLTKANEKQIDAQQHVDATLRNAEVIQAMGMMPALVTHWQVRNTEVLNLQMAASERAAVIVSFSKFTRLFIQIAILGLGAYLVVTNKLTSGAMMAASILMSRALAPVEQAIGSWKQMIGARSSYIRLNKHFEVTTKRTAGISLPAPTGKLELSGVYYYSPTTHKPILSNINLNIQAGEMVALIGPSAAGKTTLARLLMGVYAPTNGNVRLDGADVYSWDREPFGHYVGYLPQDIELFNGSIKENIARMGAPDDAAVIQAAQLAGVHELILKLPNGYDTKVGTSLSLSGGQRQRIALARALYKLPKLLVLDEPNSNLDNDGELALQKALLEMRKLGSTIVMIAHRPSMVQFVDTIVVLNAGQIQFAGPRDEILAKVQAIGGGNAR